MPNPHVPAAATGLPTPTPDQAIADLRAGLVAHFADLGQIIDLDAEIPALATLDAESVEVARHRIRGLRLAIAARFKAEDVLIDAIAGRKVSR